MKKKLFIVVNVDWFFLSHRLPIALAAQKSGYEVTIVTRDTGKSSEIKNYGLNFINVPFIRSGTNVFHELKCILILRSIYRKYSPDIVHHVTLKVSLYGSIAARMASVTGVVNAISGLGYNFTDNRKGGMRTLILKLFQIGFKRKKICYIFQNEDDIKIFRGLNIVQDDQISLIKGSGVDLNEYTEVVVPNKEKVIILFAARMLYDKGVVEFIQAARLLESKFNKQVQFVLAGDIDNENLATIKEVELRAMIDEKFIIWIGFQSNMIKLIAGCDIVVLPSYREGLPKILIEAAAIGRPIITTDVPGCKDCVIDGYNGFLVPSKNVEKLSEAMEKLIVDQQRRIVMGKNSRTLAEKEFSINNVINKTFEIYSMLLAG